MKHSRLIGVYRRHAAIGMITRSTSKTESPGWHKLGRCEMATTSWIDYTNPGGVVTERRQWGTVVRCIGRAVGTRDYVEPAYEAALEFAVPSSARPSYRLRAHPNGRRLFRDKPDILEVLRDDKYLSSLPVGTLGHAYRSFMTNISKNCIIISCIFVSSVRS